MRKFNASLKVPVSVSDLANLRAKTKQLSDDAGKLLEEIERIACAERLLISADEEILERDDEQE